jgi:hypothetical protein
LWALQQNRLACGATFSPGTHRLPQRAQANGAGNGRDAGSHPRRFALSARLAHTLRGWRFGARSRSRSVGGQYTWGWWVGLNDRPHTGQTRSGLGGLRRRALYRSRYLSRARLDESREHVLHQVDKPVPSFGFG